MTAYASSQLFSIHSDQIVIMISFFKHNFSSETFDFKIRM